MAFSSPKLKKHTITFLWQTVLFNIFMRQTLTDTFWGLHKNMNCVFPLSLLHFMAIYFKARFPLDSK